MSTEHAREEVRSVLGSDENQFDNVSITVASPETSVNYAGSRWELLLSLAKEVLTLMGLRHRLKLLTDGGVMSGGVIVFEAILGADEFGIGTLSLVAMG